MLSLLTLIETIDSDGPFNNPPISLRFLSLTIVLSICNRLSPISTPAVCAGEFSKISEITIFPFIFLIEAPMPPYSPVVVNLKSSICDSEIYTV